MLDRMMAYDWPGNARELRNTIERAVILCPDGAPLDAGHLPPGFRQRRRFRPRSLDASVVQVRVGTTVDEAERLLILRTLEATGTEQDPRRGNSGREPEDLHNKLKEYSNSRRQQRV
jgi:DNA-binding NtrC family response regulator